MAYDNVSTEIAVLDDFAGAKIQGIDSCGKSRKFRFTALAMADGETGQMTTALPKNAYISAIFIEADSGTGTINVGTSGGTATDILTAADPSAADVFAGKNVSASGSAVYATATGAVTVSGWVEYVASA